MRTSIVPSCDAQLRPHVVVIGNHKGGSGKSTFAVHIIVALLKAGKRVASFDLDLDQLTLTRYLGNRREWNREHEPKLDMPDHYSVTEEGPYVSAWSHGADLKQFISKLEKIGRHDSASNHSTELRRFTSQLKKVELARKHDFIVIDTPGGVQHLSLIAHGLADTLITPINDSLFDLDVLVEIERSNVKPQPSVYAKTVRRAIEARRKVSDRATNWIVVRNRQELIPSNNQRRVNRVLDVIQQTLGFRIARGLLERHVYREFFAEGLTVLDPIEKLKSATGPGSPNLLARLEVETLIREVGLIEDHVSLEMKSFTRSSWKWQKPAVTAKDNLLERRKSVAQ
jgi:chromosome partitioning protein